MPEPLPTLQLTGRAAVITGAGSGIGRALALHAAQQGMQVALADIDTDALAAVEHEIKALGADCFSTVVDVRKRDQLDAFAGRVFTAFPSVALVFANAGVMRAATSWLQPATDWELIVDVNLKGAGHTAAAFMPQLLAQNSPAQLVFTGSTSAFSPRPQISAYSSTKHALWGLAEAMYLELKMLDAPVSVSFLAPSGVRTAIFNTPSQAPGGEVQDMLRAAIEAMGMPPEQLAEITFAALKERKFWILPHPDFKAALEARVARIVAESPPEFA
ncbi:MAG TPA: SDR family NAD(P)-dependent oxidoreductase [Spongiibacteraceae bacterium]|nr:SDR family NAD(P)-dependent oxidoreductase [Spongiibacteraceae bacterium]